MVADVVGDVFSLFIRRRGGCYHGEAQQGRRWFRHGEGSEHLWRPWQCKFTVVNPTSWTVHEDEHLRLGFFSVMWIRSRWTPRSASETQGMSFVRWWRSWEQTCWWWAAMAMASSKGRPTISPRLEISHASRICKPCSSSSSSSRTFLGSVSDHCARNAKCPVLIVKRQAKWCLLLLLRFVRMPQWMYRVKFA